MIMLRCYWTRRRLDAFVDGALPPDAGRRVAGHVETCARCGAETRALRRLQAALRRTAAASPPEDWTGFWPGVVRGIEAARRQPVPHPPGRSWRRPRLALGFSGALAAGLLLVLTLWQPFFSSNAPEGAVVVSAAATGDPRGTVMVYAPPERDVAVVWVFGLDDPAD
jgi:anti-sigma factor RsiW